MIVVVTTLQILLGLIYLASSTAFNAVLSMAILGMYASYLSPICFMLLYGRKSWTRAPSGHNFGPFQLGRYMGPVINAVSIIWLIIAMIFSTFPTLRPVTPENMNYCIVVTVGWIAIGAFYYFLGGKTRFKGPVVYFIE
jgi:amino acid transporter